MFRDVKLRSELIPMLDWKLTFLLFRQIGKTLCLAFHVGRSGWLTLNTWVHFIRYLFSLAGFFISRDDFNVTDFSGHNVLGWFWLVTAAFELVVVTYARRRHKTNLLVALTRFSAWRDCTPKANETNHTFCLAMMWSRNSGTLTCLLCLNHICGRGSCW